MSTKKLFGIFIVTIFLCIGALVYLLMDDGPNVPVIDPSNQSGENINPGVEIVLSGDANNNENKEDISGEYFSSGENGYFSGDNKDDETQEPVETPIEIPVEPTTPPKDNEGEGAQNPIETPTETESPKKEEYENVIKPGEDYLAPSVNRVEDSFIEEVKTLLEPGKYKFYYDDEKLVYVLKDSQVMVYEYEGDVITGYKKYDAYATEFIAKIIADSNNTDNGPSLNNVNKVTYCENFVIWEYSAGEYSKYTVKDIKSMYSQYQIK